MRNLPTTRTIQAQQGGKGSPTTTNSHTSRTGRLPTRLCTALHPCIAPLLLVSTLHHRACIRTNSSAVRRQYSTTTAIRRDHRHLPIIIHPLRQWFSIGHTHRTLPCPLVRCHWLNPPQVPTSRRYGFVADLRHASFSRFQYSLQLQQQMSHQNMLLAASMRPPPSPLPAMFGAPLDYSQQMPVVMGSVVASGAPMYGHGASQPIHMFQHARGPRREDGPAALRSPLLDEFRANKTRKWELRVSSPSFSLETCFSFRVTAASSVARIYSVISSSSVATSMAPGSSSRSLRARRARRSRLCSMRSCPRARCSSFKMSSATM